ncbi:MAG: DUF1385 domain-containing protein [Chloroflexi bacterium]|nr:DUF1385 domain-containing protein [Chloroflexota bacterium]
MPRKFHYGGQAVFEGVMMLGQRNMAMAVRRPGGDLALITKPLSSAFTGRVRRIPLVRGIVVLVQTLLLGMQALFQSANIALEEEKQEISGLALWGIMIASLAFAVTLFFLAPLGLTHLVDSHLGSSLASNVVEGVIRIAIFFLYLAIINLMPDIRRIFAYHGAEHKTVNAYEDKAPLEVDEVRKYSTAHLRCGTAFLFIVLVIAIVVFALLGSPPMWLRILSRILLIPVIAAIAYEITHLSARYSDNRLVHLLFIPGLAIQRMTTRQPDDGQIETAICALNGVIQADNPQESA